MDRAICDVMTTTSVTDSAVRDGGPQEAAGPVPPAAARPADRTPLWFRTTPACPLLVLPLAILFAALAARPLWHTDVWGHLAYGRLIWEMKALPTTEPFLPLARGVELIDTAWLSQVTGYLVLERFGLPGLQALAAVCVTAAAAILVWLGYRKTGRVAFALLGLAAFLWLSWKQLFNGSDTSLLIRPQLAGLVAFTITLAVAMGRPSRWHWGVIPVTFALWANLHGSWFAGLALLGVMALGRGGDVLRRTDKFAAIARDWPFWRLVLLTELAAVAVLLNPYGLRLFAEVWLFSQNPNLQNLVEWEPLTLRMTQGQAAAGITLVLLCLYRMTPRRIGTGEALALLLFGGLTLWTSRMIVWFAPVAAYCVAVHAAAVWRGFAVRSSKQSPAEDTAGDASSMTTPRALWTVAAIGAAWLGLAMTPFAQRVAYGPRPQDEQAVSLQTPTAAARHLAESPPAGLVFNTYQLGDYLLWTNPGLPLFVHSHAHLVPTDVWQDYTTTIRGGGNWRATLDRYGVNTIVLDRPGRQDLIDQLAEEPDWVRSFQDRNSAVFRRASQRGEP